MRRRHVPALLTAAAVAVTGLTGAAFADTAPAAPDVAAATACAPSAILEPCDGTAMFGGWAKGYTVANSFQKIIDDTELRYGRQLDIVHSYHASDSSPVPFSADPAEKWGPTERRLTQSGRRIVLANFKPSASIEKTEKMPSDFAATARGDHDVTIVAAARNIAQMAPHKVMVALHHEPENDIGANSGGCAVKAGNLATNTPESYRAMWKHTREVFDREGATNVIWVMNYMSLPKWDCLVTEVWPGNDLVDWVAYDPYSDDGSVDEVVRFADLLEAQSSPTHDFTGKPWMLAEYGTTVRSTAKQERELGVETARENSRVKAREFYDNMGRLLTAGTIDRLKALVVFDSKTGANDINLGVGVDAWNTADPAEQAAFNRLAQHPTFLTSITN